MTQLDRSWSPPPQFGSYSRRNIGEVERWMSGLGGAALAAWAFQRRTPDPWAVGAGALSALLLYRASTAHCPAYAAAGISTADRTNTKRALSGPRGVIVESAVRVNRPASELYAFWRALDNLPRVMQHLQSVTVLDDRRSRWVATAPLGTTVEWEAEIINEVPDRVIGWRSVEGSTVVTAGSVNFEDDGAGTNVRVRLQYDPPGGKLGSWVAWVFGEEPSVQVDSDLRRFKELMEG
ncbi:MAG TPA: SRPBCC family protein [Vicinamibacterales bacterium]|jgi:uncharacterized membrane protein|nr:SRPBCC family protein [Vicinamibacterales bacterium]